MEDIQYLPLTTVYICTSSLPPSTQGAEISLLVKRADFTNQKITSAGKNVEKVPSLGNNFKRFSCYRKGKLRDSAETSTEWRERNWWPLRDKTTSFYRSAIHSSQNAIATEIPANRTDLWGFGEHSSTWQRRLIWWQKGSRETGRVRCSNSAGPCFFWDTRAESISCSFKSPIKSVFWYWQSLFPCCLVAEEGSQHLESAASLGMASFSHLWV